MGELYQKTVSELTAALQNKEVSSVEVTKSVLSRIDSVENDVKAYLARTDALEKAKAVDERRAKGEKLSPIAGIPFALKDNICTEGIATTCSSRMLENFVPPYSAYVARRLLEADGVLLGKLNMDEFAMGSSTETSYMQKTHNPFDLSCVPGGSSGGCAASVAAGEAFFSLGTDTGGSIRQPSSLCGVVGLKPTYGRVSRWGVVSFASSLDQVGPITKNVEDSATILQAIAGQDPMDTSSLDAPVPDYSQALKKGVKGMRIGIPKEYFGEGISQEVRDSVLDLAKKLEAEGAIVEECTLPNTQYALPAYYIISSAEATSNLGRYDGVKYGYRAAEFDGLDDMMRRSRSEGFGAEVKRRIMLGTYVLSAGYYDAYYKHGQQVRTLIIRDFQTMFDQYDVLLTPTTPTTTWRFDKKKSLLEMYASDICTVSVNVAGLPAITIPCGLGEGGLPIGAQFIGNTMREEDIFQAAFAAEQLLPAIKTTL